MGVIRHMKTKEARLLPLPESRQRAARVRLRRHAAAERFPARNEGEVRRKTAHFPHRGADILVLGPLDDKAFETDAVKQF